MWSSLFVAASSIAVSACFSAGPRCRSLPARLFSSSANSVARVRSRSPTITGAIARPRVHCSNAASSSSTRSAAREASAARPASDSLTICDRSSTSYRYTPSSLFTAGSTSRGTAMSMKKRFRPRRAFRTPFIRSSVTTYAGLDVDDTTMSASASA